MIKAFQNNYETCFQFSIFFYLNSLHKIESKSIHSFALAGYNKIFKKNISLLFIQKWAALWTTCKDVIQVCEQLHPFQRHVKCIVSNVFHTNDMTIHILWTKISIQMYDPWYLYKGHVRSWVNHDIHKKTCQIQVNIQNMFHVKCEQWYPCKGHVKCKQMLIII